MSLEDEWRVQHMIDACEQTIEFAAGRSRSDLDSDKMSTFALVRAVEVIGEQPRRFLPKVEKSYWKCLGPK